MTQSAKESKAVRQLFSSYATGFGLSLILTAIAFAVTSKQVQSDGEAFSHQALIAGLFILAVTQLVVQLMFFFHLGRETKPRLNTVSFLFMLMVVGIIGLGSLWIMSNLSYNMMPRDVENFIKNDENIKTDQMKTGY